MKKLIILIAIIATIITGTIIYYQNRTITLHLAMMTGSNWNVPEYDSFTQIDEAITRFEDKYPNVKITYETGITPELYDEYVARKIIKHEPLDMIFIPSSILNDLINCNALEPLNKYIVNYHLDTNKYYSSSLESGMIDNVIYSLPYESVPRVMFVNKTLLEKENIAMPDNDWTWQDFYNICKQITKDTNNDNIIDQFGIYGYSFEDAYYSNDSILYNEKTNTISIDDNIIEAVSFLRNLNKLHNERLSSEMFDKGYVAFCPMDYSNYRTYKPYPWRVKKYSNFEWDCITMPSGYSGDNTSLINTLSLGVLQNSKHKELAFEFIQSLSYDKNYQTELVINSQGVSVLKEVMTSQVVIDTLNQDNPGDSTFNLSVLNEIMNNGIPVKYSEEYNQVMQLADAKVDELINNDDDIKNAMVRLQLQINAMLQK